MRSILLCRLCFRELKKRDIINYNPEPGTSEHDHWQLPLRGYSPPLEQPQSILEAIREFVGSLHYLTFRSAGVISVVGFFDIVHYYWGLRVMFFDFLTCLRRTILLALVLAGCVSQLGNYGTANNTPPGDINGGRGTGANAVPLNYRQLVARKLAETVDSRAFSEAEISQPAVRNMAMIGFDWEPTVCVSAVPKGRGEYPAWIFMFQDGQVSKMFVPMRIVGCRGLEWSAFPEFMNRN